MKWSCFTKSLAQKTICLVNLSFYFITASATADTIIGKNPYEIIEMLLQKVNALEGNQVEMNLAAFDTKSEEQNMILWYKKGGFIRLKQLGPHREGALVVFNPLEHMKFQVRPGGFLSFMTVKLDPDSSILKAVTGDSIKMVDYYEILNACAQVLEKHLESFQIDESVFNEQKVFILTAHIKAKGNKFDFIHDENVYRFFLTKKDLLLVRLERYKDQHLLNAIDWKNFRVIAEFDPGLFQLQ